MNNEQKDHSLPSASLVQNGVLAEDFTQVVTAMPPKVDEFNKYPVSKNLIFRTKRKEFKGYYHYADKQWYTVEEPYYKGRWARRITNVVEWKVVS